MSEFRDPDMENLLGRSGGPFPDVNVALQQVQGRVRQARRRRVVVVGGAACSLLFAFGVFAAARTAGPRTVQPGDNGSLVSTDDSQLRPGSSAASSTSPSTSTSTSTSTSVAVSVSIAAAVPSTTAATSVANSSPHTTSPHTTSPRTSVPATAPPTAPSSAPGTTAPATMPTTPTPSTAPVTRTFSGVGGSITVRLEGGTLTLLSQVAAPGFTTEVKHSSGSHVEVRFESATHRTDARVDLDNGEMAANFDEADL